jgi:ABC-type nitrate/sulfonate/bicarbonate transport system permease component
MRCGGVRAVARSAILGGRLLPAAIGVASIVAAFGVLEVLLRTGLVNRYIIPLPSDVIMSLWRVIEEEDILLRLRETAFEMSVAAILVIIIGVPIGTLLYWFRPLRRAIEDWVAAFAAAPLVLAFPLFLVLFGRSSATVIVMSVITGLAPIILTTTEGLAGTRPVLINVGRSLNMSNRQMFFKILLPAAMPVIFSGIRLSWTFVLISVVGIEFLINLGGLGQLINDLAERYDMPGTYASIVFVIAVSVVFFVLLERVEAWLQPGT